MRLNRDYFPAIGLGATQIMGYGTLMYAYAVLAERKREYVAWAQTVVGPLPHRRDVALQAFDSRCEATLKIISGS